MRAVLGFIGCFAASLVACSDVSPSSREPITFTVTAWNADPSQRERLEGVTVCEMDTARCGVTDRNGRTEIRLPVGEETAYTLDHPDYAAVVFAAIIPPGREEIQANMVDAQGQASGHAAIGSPYPMRGTGTVVVQLIPGFAGATYELIAATGKPFYMDESWNMTPGLDATTGTGIGGFTEVTPGEVEVKVGGTARDCLTYGNWPTDIENGVRVPVREGHLTVAVLNCGL